jgi:hypothetical protein
MDIAIAFRVLRHRPISAQLIDQQLDLIPLDCQPIDLSVIVLFCSYQFVPQRE